MSTCYCREGLCGQALQSEGKHVFEQSGEKKKALRVEGREEDREQKGRRGGGGGEMGAQQAEGK